MPEPYLGSPSGTIEILRKYNISARKKFGQNFLIDDGVLSATVDAAELTPEDAVLEIGPGIGTLTQYLAASAGHVVAVEIDRSLSSRTSRTTSQHRSSCSSSRAARRSSRSPSWCRRRSRTA